jgi:hypothetical protein
VAGGQRHRPPKLTGGQLPGLLRGIDHLGEQEDVTLLN